MTILTEGKHTGEHLVSESNGTRSREEVTVLQAATPIVSGTLMGKVTASGKYKAYSNGASDGTEVAAGVLYTSLPAGTDEVKAVLHVRDCEVAGINLTGADTPGVADLKALGVIVR
jgi:hypothetical protein